MPTSKNTTKEITKNSRRTVFIAEDRVPGNLHGVENLLTFREDLALYGSLFA